VAQREVWWHRWGCGGSDRGFVAQMVKRQTANSGSNLGIPRLGLVAQPCYPATRGPEQGMAWGGGLDNLEIICSWYR
jgi:hypothetical protein